MHLPFVPQGVVANMCDATGDAMKYRSWQQNKKSGIHKYQNKIIDTICKNKSWVHKSLNTVLQYYHLDLC